MKNLFITAILFASLCVVSLHAHDHSAEEQTLSIIKPDAVAKNKIGKVISYFENAGLSVAAMKMVQLSKEQAETFYAVHKDRPFYPALVDFMISGPVVVMVLEGPDAVAMNRKIMGATDPAKAESGTIRSEVAESVQKNAVHGSDSKENAKNEITYFFKPEEIVR